MKIVCATSVALGQEAFATMGDVAMVPEREITPAIVRDADALITRSKVRINAQLLEGSRVSFVATATAGTDHIDADYVAARALACVSAPGCNANSVGEYVVAALLTLAQRHAFRLEGRTLGVVGVGHVGARVTALARALGMNVLLNDPPRAAAEGLPELRPLDDVLAAADVLSLHVPLTLAGGHATHRLVNDRFLSRLKPGCLFINASRGEVVDEDCLLQALDRGWVSRAVLDVFEGEPRLRRDVAARADLISPHIAGYSFEGRVRGTEMCYRAACRFFGREPAWDPAFIYSASRGRLRASCRGRDPEEVLLSLVKAAYDIEADDRALRAGLDADDAQRGRHFQRVRSAYPERHEFPGYAVALEDADPGLRSRVRGLGFHLEAKLP